MTIRILTVSYCYNQHDAVIPFIRLQGKWLAKSGFHHGDKIQVAVEYERLVITKLTPEENKA